MRKGKWTRSRLLKPVYVGVALFLGVGLVAACESATGPDGQGQMTVLLTDAPFPFDLVSEANVTISRVDVVGEAGVVILAEGEQSFNLLDLQNGVTAALASAEMPEGDLVQVRLIVTEASVVLTDGTEFDLAVPSGSETGIKITMPPGAQVEAGGETTATLDFSVEESFIVQGSAETVAGIEGFIFTPVITVMDLQVESQAQAGGEGS